MNFKIINKPALPRGGGRSILRSRKSEQREEEMKRGNRLEGTRVVSLLLLASSFGKAFDRFEESRSGDVPFENEGQDFEG